VPAPEGRDEPTGPALPAEPELDGAAGPEAEPEVTTEPEVTIEPEGAIEPEEAIEPDPSRWDRWAGVAPSAEPPVEPRTVPARFLGLRVEEVEGEPVVEPELDRPRARTAVGSTARRRPVPVGAIAVGVGLLVLGAGLGRWRSNGAAAGVRSVAVPSSARPGPVSIDPASTQPPSTDPSSTNLPSTTDPKACPADAPVPVPPEGTPGRRPGSAVVVDLDGDGCAGPAVITGTRIRIGATTFEAGRPGDRVAVDDWDCDGVPTPAVVRPGTGEVFVFDRWDPGGGPQTVAPITVVEGATEIARGAADGCAGAVVRRGAAAPMVLDPTVLDGGERPDGS
jgi:hypothetical protein